MPKRLGIVPFRYASPLAEHLRRRVTIPFTLVPGTPGELAVRLRQKELDGAFLSPVDFAREYQMYRLVPGVAVSSSGESGRILLVFHERMNSIKTIAVNPGFTSEVVLATLLMMEKYDTRPTLVPAAGSLDEQLTRADAVLCAGDIDPDVLARTNKIDLVEDWTDYTDLPFVHGVWAARPGALTDAEITALSEPVQDPADASPAGCRFDLTDDLTSAMNEFFRMAYYHGILRDIPEIHFFGE